MFYKCLDILFFLPLLYAIFIYDDEAIVIDVHVE